MKKTERRTKRQKTEITTAPAVNSKRTRAGRDTGEYLNLDEIKELIELISDKQFNEFELERGAFRLRLQKGQIASVAKASNAAAAEAPGASEPRISEFPATRPSDASGFSQTPAHEETPLYIINSPIVGTFYRAPSPAAEPFVKLGDTVETGKTLCIIEAMKLMNEILADASGVIAKIFVENGQPVEFGQPLFGIKV